MSEEKRTSRVVPWLLVLLPALLLISAAGAVWMHWRSETAEDPHPGLAMGTAAMGDDELRDILRKLTEYIGPRDWETPEGRGHIRQAIAFLSGSLSPRNYGYVVRSGGELSLAGERWPTVWVDAEGTGGGTVLVAVPYDGDDASLAAVLAVAGELREAELRRTVRFAFYPAELWAGTDDGVAGVLGSADVVVCVNQLGPGRDLWSTGPGLAEGEGYLRVAVDGHVERAGGPGEERHFARAGGRVFEIRGAKEGGGPDAAETDGVATAGRKLDDLRARVGRLGVILRGAANSR